MTSKRTSYAVLLLIVLGFALRASGDSGAGDAAHFLRDGIGARGRGAGSAYTALADDYTAVFWNPAPSLQSPSTVVGGGLEQRNAGLFTFSVLGGRYAADAWGAGAVVVTSDLYDVYQLAGGFRLRHFAAGLGVKYYRFGIVGDSGSGLGLDLGARYVIDLGGAAVTIAVVSRDVGWTSILWGAAETLAVDRVAWVNRVGVALSVPFRGGTWSVAADGEWALRRPPGEGEPGYWEQAAEGNLSAGAAVRWGGISLRAGVQRWNLFGGEARLRPTFGIGLAVGRVVIDLALIPSSLGATYLGGFQVGL